MKQFVIGGLDTPEKKSEAEAILKELGYVDDKYWNREYRGFMHFTFILTTRKDLYAYHCHDCQQIPITLEKLRTMKNQEK